MTRVMGAFAVLAVAAYAPSVAARQSTQKAFSSPEEAAEALFAAAQAADEQALSQILAADKDIFSAGDEGQDDEDRRRFVEKYREMHRFAEEPEGTVLYIGAENWPFPVPLAKKNGAWSFDTRAGMREVLLRRVGSNESFAIDVCSALGQLGKRDTASIVGNDVPLNGYYFRAVAAQETRAAFLAYPAEYGSSGVMTFLVGHDGVVYERDLGPGTAKIAARITSYKPDRTWHAVQ